MGQYAISGIVRRVNVLEITKTGGERIEERDRGELNHRVQSPNIISVIFSHNASNEAPLTCT